MKKLFVRIFSFVMIFALLTSFSFTGAAAKTVTGSNWMSAVSDSSPITSLTIPGTHNAATQYVNASIISRTQSLSIAQQLQIGVRYLDIRLEKTDTGFIAVHGIADCKVDGSVFAENLTASRIIEYCRDFLKANPTETIFFQVKEDDGSTGEAFYSSFYDLYIKETKELWFAENRIPTLGEVRGKIVLLRAVGIDSSSFDDSNSGINFSSYPYIGGQEEHDYRRRDISKLNGDNYASMYVQDSYKLEGDKKWTAVKDFLDSDLSPADFNICLTSCTNISTPQFNALDINPRLMNYSFQKGKTYGVVAVDFIDKDLSEHIFSANSAVTVAQEPDGSTAPPPTEPSDRPEPSVPVEDTSSTLPETSTDETAAATPSEPAEETQAVTEEADNAQEKKSNKWIIAVSAAAGILLLGGGGAAAYYFIKKRQ